MQVEQNPQHQQRSVGGTAMERLRAALHIAAGVSPEDVAALNRRTSIQYATLGLVFVLNFLVLAAAWMHVGHRYWGWIGLFVPGLVVPGLFVMGIDRLVAMRARRLDGELAQYTAPNLHIPRWEVMLRVGSAVALSALTTLTFMLKEAAPDIARQQAEDARRSNASVRAELEARVESQFQLANGHAQTRLTTATEDLRLLRERVDVLGEQLNTVQRTARESRDLAVMEAGGLAGRVQGKGPKYDAQRELAAQNDAAAREIRDQLHQAQSRRDRAEQAVLEAQAAASQAMSVRSRDLAGLDDVLRSEARYVAPVQGLFADAATFVRLFSDPREGLGFWLLSVIGGGVLLVLECACLVAMALNPSSPLDVLRTVRNREDAARLVADGEVKVAQARARMGSPVAVRTAPGAARRANVGAESPPPQV